MTRFGHFICPRCGRRERIIEDENGQPTAYVCETEGCPHQGRIRQPRSSDERSPSRRRSDLRKRP